MRALLAALLLAACAPRAAAPAYPPTRRDDFREVLHGVEIIDPYRWLEDGKSPETRAWIDAQNAYTHAQLDGLPARPRILEGLTALARVDSQGTPWELGGRYFMSRRRASDDLSIAYVREGLSGAERVLLDPHPLSADHTTATTIADTSIDGKRIIYELRRGGTDESELHVRDVDTATDLPDTLPYARYRGVSFSGDGSGFYYALQDPATGIRILYHTLGTPTAGDKEIFAGKGPDEWVYTQVSENGRWLVLGVGKGWQSNDLYLQDLAGKGPIKPLVVGLDGHFNVSFAGDRMIMLTDYQAPNGRVVEILASDPAPARWREIVPTRKENIEGVYLAGGKIAVHSLVDVAARVELFTVEGKPLGEVPLPGKGAIYGISSRWGSRELFFGFVSYIEPGSSYRMDLETGKVEPFWRPQVPFNPEEYESKQVWYTSRDGTRVPMFVTHKKGLALDGNNPTLLTGYGGFALSITPAFSTLAAWWIAHGGVFAVPNLRGGSEFGEAWHKAGMLANKQNVFDDFIAAAEWLVANHYTTPARLAIRGGSNGGLLVGSAFTQRPDLYRAVLCEFPDLDMIGFHRFPGNNPPALLEYGDASKPDEFKFLYAYSPYQHVKPGTAYPAILFITGDADTRVPPLQARKMTARVQAATSSGRQVMLLYDTKAGHAGGKPLTKVLEDLSLSLAFVTRELGMEVK